MSLGAGAGPEVSMPMDVRAMFASHFPVVRPRDDTSLRRRKVVVRYWSRPGHVAAGAVFENVTVAQACAELVRALGLDPEGFHVGMVTAGAPVLAVKHSPIGVDGRRNERIGRIVAAITEGLTESELMFGLTLCAMAAAPAANAVRGEA